MKTSNKILIAILLMCFGYLAIAQVALHIKYAKKDVTDPARYNAFYYDDYDFKHINYIRLAGLADCQLVPADATKLSVEKSNFNYVHFKVNADTLVVQSENPEERSADSKLNRSAQNIRLYLPRGSDVSALNSNIRVKGSREPGNKSSFHFNLTGSNLFTRFNYGIDSLERYFDTLSVHAVKSSQVILFYNDRFSSLNVRLDHSMINDFHAKIDQANILTDSSSVMVISGGNINKVNATAIKK